MQIIEYGEKEIEFLSKKDKKLGAFIKKRGFVERRMNPDVFFFLVRSIVTQQISNKAAATVVGRLKEKFPDITADTLYSVSDEELQSIGISMRKVSYIKGLCASVLGGELSTDLLRGMSDAEVARSLLPIKGIGIWTVEMTLIFSLGRRDVVSFGDYAIRKGMMNLYGIDELTRETFEKYRKR
ncbi:MAG: DNA-3-methyladenine glycosylase 2 family protein, partial [Synergistaceae bacterium]